MGGSPFSSTRGNRTRVAQLDDGHEGRRISQTDGWTDGSCGTGRTGWPPRNYGKRPRRSSSPVRKPPSLIPFGWALIRADEVLCSRERAKEMALSFVLWVGFVWADKSHISGFLSGEGTSFFVCIFADARHRGGTEGGTRQAAGGGRRAASGRRETGVRNVGGCTS
jgi:hypothetical protein